MDEIPDSIHSVEQHLQQIKAFRSPVVQCSPFILLYMGKILQRNYREMTIYGHFPIIP